MKGGWGEMPGKWRKRKVESNSSEMWREKECSTLRRNELFGDIGRLPQPKDRPAKGQAYFSTQILAPSGKRELKAVLPYVFPI